MEAFFCITLSAWAIKIFWKNRNGHPFNNTKRNTVMNRKDI